MNYITNAATYQVCVGNQKPKIYGFKPDKHYLVTTANQDLLDYFFESNVFKELMYLNGVSMFIEQCLKSCWYQLPFDFVHYKNDIRA